MTVHPHDDLAAYAIGALDPVEAAAVRAHLAGCAACRIEVEAYAGATWQLARTAEREPPRSVRHAIVERARRDRGGEGRPSALGALRSLLRRPVPLALPVTLAVLLAVALAGYAGARRDADRYAAALASIVDARVVALAPSGEMPGVRGAVVIPASGAPYLLLDLPAAPAGKTWEAWVIRGQVPAAAGITSERGLTTLALTASLAAGDVVAVTLEPSGGTAQPTGAILLSGRA